MRGKDGTIKYCTVITLEVRNALTLTSLNLTRRALAAIVTPSYLTVLVLFDRYLTQAMDPETTLFPRFFHEEPLLWNIK